MLAPSTSEFTNNPNSLLTLTGYRWGQNALYKWHLCVHTHRQIGISVTISWNSLAECYCNTTKTNNCFLTEVAEGSFRNYTKQKNPKTKPQTQKTKQTTKKPTQITKKPIAFIILSVCISPFFKRWCFSPVFVLYNFLVKYRWNQVKKMDQEQA